MVMKIELFLFAVDGRARLDPPLPVDYFGNCFGYGLGKVLHEELVGPDGFFATAKATANEIKNRVNDKEEFMKRAENGTTIFDSLFQVCSAPKRRFRAYQPEVKKDANDINVRKARKEQIKRDKAIGQALPFAVALGVAALAALYFYLNSTIQG